MSLSLMPYVGTYGDGIELAPGYRVVLDDSKDFTLYINTDEYTGEVEGRHSPWFKYAQDNASCKSKDVARAIDLYVTYKFMEVAAYCPDVFFAFIGDNYEFIDIINYLWVFLRTKGISNSTTADEIAECMQLKKNRDYMSDAPIGKAVTVDFEDKAVNSYVTIRANNYMRVGIYTKSSERYDGNFMLPFDLKGLYDFSSPVFPAYFDESDTSLRDAVTDIVCCILNMCGVQSYGINGAFINNKEIGYMRYPSKTTNIHQLNSYRDVKEFLCEHLEYVD